MRERSSGRTLFATALLAAGLAGLAGVWIFWPRTSNTSPLAALSATAWSCTYILTAVLTWRRSRVAAPGFLAAVGLLLPLFWFLIPGNLTLFLAMFVFTFLLALLGYRYLRKEGERVA